MKEFAKYNHELKNVYEACGITDAEMEAAVEKFSELQNKVIRSAVQTKGFRPSKGIEMLTTELTERELYIIYTFLVKREIENNLAEVAENMMKKIFGNPKKMFKQFKKGMDDRHGAN